MNTPLFKALVIFLIAGVGLFFILNQPLFENRPLNWFFIAAGVACLIEAVWLFIRDFDVLMGRK